LNFSLAVVLHRLSARVRMNGSKRYAASGVV
jgi:hypothetical protein